MDHEETLARADEYIDGGLSKRDQRDVDKHLKTCTSCSDEVGNIRALLARAKQLPRELEPNRDLWPGLEGRLGPQQGEHVSPSNPGAGTWKRLLNHGVREALAVAAAVAILLSGTFLAPSQQVPGDNTRPTVSRTTQMGPKPPTATFARMMWGMELESRAAGRTFTSALRKDSNPGAIEGVQSIDSGLEVLNRAIAASSEALRADPENPELLKRLSGYYRKRLALLQQATQLATRS